MDLREALGRRLEDDEAPPAARRSGEGAGLPPLRPAISRTGRAYRKPAKPRARSRGAFPGSMAALQARSHRTGDGDLMSPRAPIPARYPPTGTWPAVMRADMAAAYLDYRDTGELSRAVGRGEAPAPTSFHGVGRSKEPVWAKASLDSFISPGRSTADNPSSKTDLASLV